jgi:hypothetical protein
MVVAVVVAVSTTEWSAARAMPERAAASVLLVLPPQICRTHLKLLLLSRSPPQLAGECEVVSSCSSVSSRGPGSRGKPQGGYPCRIWSSPELQVVVVGQSACAPSSIRGGRRVVERSARPPPQGRCRREEVRRRKTRRWPGVARHLEQGCGPSSRGPPVRSKVASTSPHRELRWLQIGERGGGLAVRR